MICDHLIHIAPRKSVVVVSRFRAQKQLIRGYLQRMGHGDIIKVTTTTGALGTQADIVLFSLTRNNPGRNVGAAGTLQDINVAISRAKEKLIILGNFEMMLKGWTSSPIDNKYHYRSPARGLAQLIDLKYGKIIDPPAQLVVR